MNSDADTTLVAQSPQPEPQGQPSSPSSQNPLVVAATPLLLMVGVLRAAHAPSNIVDLRNRMIERLRDFDESCFRQQVSEYDRHAASYALCTLVDECVQMTPWGTQAHWAQQSLLVHFHHENWGGETFFKILDGLAASPARYRHLLELYYAILSLGFMGRFHMEGAQGRQTVTALRDGLFQLIRVGRPVEDRTLSTRWQGLSLSPRQSAGFVAVGAALCVGAVLCLALYAFLWQSLGARRDELGLDSISVGRPAPPAREPPAPKARLAQLLRSQIDRSQLAVDDFERKSVVTLVGERTFESGSATPSSGATALIADIARALQQLEGRVMVYGYTDSVPTHTLRFDNNALSTARAETVAELIRARLSTPSRVGAEGMGERNPIGDNTTAEGRMQNRRIEIVLTPPELQR